MAEFRVPAKQAFDFCVTAFKKMGFSAEDSVKIAKVLNLADVYGIESHGIQRMWRYYTQTMNGSIHKDEEPEIVFETPVSAVIEGHDGMGQLISHKAMELAIEKAKKSGMAIVSVRNSNHYGIAGYYTKLAAEQGMIALSMTNTEAMMVHTNSKKPILGTNPIAMAVPADPHPFWFDAATTVVTRGKLELYAKKEKPLPEGWAVDENGNPCTDSKRVLDNIIAKRGGGILPLGGSEEETGSHKGYGFGMMCEIFTAILSGGQTSNHHVRVEKKGAGSCHAFIVIDPAAFGDAAEIKANMSRLMQELRDSAKADGKDCIYVHGDKEALAQKETEKSGIIMKDKTLDELKKIAEDLGFEAKFDIL